MDRPLDQVDPQLQERHSDLYWKENIIRNLMIMSLSVLIGPLPSPHDEIMAGEVVWPPPFTSECQMHLFLAMKVIFEPLI